MFNRLVMYIREKRTRTKARALPSAQDAALQVASAEHLPRRPETPDGDTEVTEDHPDDPCHDAAARDEDEPNHTQDLFTPQVSAGDAIVDSFTLGNMWNSFVTINNLPAELLVEIFLCTRLGGWCLRDRPLEPIKHMLVCRHWRDIVVDHVCFWSTIDIRKSAEWFKLGLSRSRQAALHLRVHDSTTLASALPDLEPHHTRIRNLEIVCCSSEEILDLSPLLFSRLESLTKFEITPHFRARALVLSPERYPQLMCLEIAGLYLQWTTPLVSRLTVLCLTDCIIWPSRMDIDAFLDVLQYGQRLRKLTLVNFMGAACTNAPSLPRRPFALPNLRDLHITDTVLRVRQFAAFLQFPTHSNVQLTGVLGTGDLDDGPLGPCELLLPRELRDMPFVGLADLLCLYQSVYRCGVSWNGNLKSLTLHFPEETIRRTSNTAMKILAETFISSKIRSLALSIDLLNVSRAAFDSLFDALPCLFYLQLDFAREREGGRPLPTRVLESLARIPDVVDANTVEVQVQADSRPDSKEAQAVVVRCRDLAYIVVLGFYWDCGDILDSLLRCLRARERHNLPKLNTLEIRMKQPWAPNDDAQDEQYAAQLRQMVSRDYKFISRARY